MRALAVLVLLLALGCAERPLSAGRFTEADFTRGRELVERFECGRCHLDHQPATCSGCHRRIVEGAERGRAEHVGGRMRAPQELAEWRGHMRNMPALPSLHAAGKLFEPAWIARFLLAPYDLRPRLGATMPRLALSEADAHDIAAYLAGVESEEPFFADQAIADFRSEHPPLVPGDRLRGRVVFDDLGCATCHAFGGAVPRPAWTVDGRDARALLLAPDLRHTRERFQPLELVPWLLEPTHHKIDASMPALPLDYQQARDLAAFVMNEPLDEAPPAPPAERLPLLDHRVRYQEVHDKVLSKSCVHCHGEPDMALDDGGPGFAGGFGFEAVELSFASYEALLAGYITPEGERRSVFARDGDGVPHLVAVLLARQQEERGIHRELRGMPLGFPALEPWQIQLVESWVAQGMPR